MRAWVRARRAEPTAAGMAPGPTFEETRHGSVHGWLPVRRRPDRGDGAPVPGRPLPLPRLPQASRGALPRLGDLPCRGGGDRGGDARLRRAVLLPALRLAGLRTDRRRDRGEPRIAGRPRPADADLRALDRAPRVRCRRFRSRGATSATATVRAAWRNSPCGGGRPGFDRNAIAVSTGAARPRSDQPQPLQAGMAVLADDDVVVDGDAERPGDVDDRPGHVDVGARRRRVA